VNHRPDLKEEKSEREMAMLIHLAYRRRSQEDFRLNPQ
jgi:hypothetical protein